MAHAEEVAAYKATHPEEFTPEAVAAYKAAHPDRVAEHHSSSTYSEAEQEIFKAGFEHYKNVVAPYKAEHPDMFTTEAIAERAAKLATYKAAHPDRFESSDATNHHHHYSEAELVVFKAGMAHAEEVAAYKATHPEEFTPEAVAAYKAAHPDRVAEHHSSSTYSEAEQEIFKAGFEHYKNVVAPYKAMHPKKPKDSKKAATVVTAEHVSA